MDMTPIDFSRVVPLRKTSSASGLTDEALASLADLVTTSRFCAWRGASDRRYVASIYPVDRDAAEGGLPLFESFVLIGVARNVAGRRIVTVAAVETWADRGSMLAASLAAGADEWHVHFLATDRAGRAAAVSDLRRRHCPADIARSA